MTVEQVAALLGVIVLIIGAIAGLLKAITDLIVAFRKKDSSPAPVVGIPAVPPDGDIDYRAYVDMQIDRDYWRDIAQGKKPPPTEPTPEVTP